MGINGRLDTVQPAILLEELDPISGGVPAAVDRVKAIRRAALRGCRGSDTDHWAKERDSVYGQYTLLAEDRDALSVDLNPFPKKRIYMSSHNTPQKNEPIFKSLNRLRFLFNRRDKTIFLVLLLGMIISAFLETFSVGMVPAFIAAAMNPEKLLQYEPAEAVLTFLDITDSRSILIWGCIGLLLLFTLKTAFLCIQYYFQVRFVQNRRYMLIRRLFSAYMGAPYQFHIQRNSAELFRNTTQEVSEIMGHVVMPILTLTMQTLMMTAILILMFCVQPLIALIATLLLGVAGGGFQLAVKKKIEIHSRIAQTHRMLMIKAIQQGLGVIKELRILRREKNFIRTLEFSQRELVKSFQFQAILQKITGPYMEFVAVFGLLAITLMLVLGGKRPESVAPILALFAVSFVKLKANINQVINNINLIRFGVISIGPVYNDLKSLEGDVENRPFSAVDSGKRGSSASKGLCRGIRVENVWYRYPGGGEYALQNVSLQVPKGACIALVGETGSGKTTLVDVILGLLEPESGRITVDDEDIQKNLLGWQTNIGYIPQFIYLTDDSIRRNIALGIDDAAIDEKQLNQSLRAAQLEPFVQRLSKGLDTIIGERGIKLSGGQRQRIGIARALYHNPDVIIMDEATSALDNATEKAVVSAINRLRGEKTIIMIAHRLSTVKNSDTMYFMNNGRIEIDGTYEALLKDHSGFRRMAQIA